MTNVLHTIRPAAKKKLPGGTALETRLGSTPGTLRTKLKLPGQKDYSDLGDLIIVDGVLELPVKLLFLSYAKEDSNQVQEIADRLWQDGFLTWLDNKDLLPGDNWRIQIQEAIEIADYILVFLSTASLSKTGYVQAELKYALEQAKLRPSAKRYIIPILLEPCEPPSDLRHLQWLDLSIPDAYTRLKTSLI